MTEHPTDAPLRVTAHMVEEGHSEALIWRTLSHAVLEAIYRRMEAARTTPIDDEGLRLIREVVSELEGLSAIEAELDELDISADLYLRLKAFSNVS